VSKLRFVFAAVAALTLGAIACEGSFSTANISEAYLSTDEAGANQTTVFGQGDVFYATVRVESAPDDTVTRVVWRAVNVQDTEPNLEINETSLEGGGILTFSLSNDQLWPLGTYAVDIYLNGELSQTLEFQVQ